MRSIDVLFVTILNQLLKIQSSFWWFDLLSGWCLRACHYYDVIMGAMASQITSLTIVYSTVYSGEDQRKHQSPASPAFVRGIRRWPVNSPHEWPVTRKMSPFDEVIMSFESLSVSPWSHFSVKNFKLLRREKNGSHFLATVKSAFSYKKRSNFF